MLIGANGGEECVYIFWVSPVSSVPKGLFTGGPGACLLAASVLDCNW